MYILTRCIFSCVQIELEVHKCLLDREMADLTHVAVLGRCKASRDKWAIDFMHTSTHTVLCIRMLCKGTDILIVLGLVLSSCMCPKCEPVNRLSNYIIKLKVSASFAQDHPCTDE